MADVQLYVNNEPLDLGGDTTIALLLQVQSMAELDAKLGSFSRSFTLPATDRNQRLLLNSYTFQASTTYPYRVTKGRLVADGLEIGVGNLIVENDGAGFSEIRLTFYLNSSPFFQLVNAMQLHQLPLGLGEHLYTYANIFAGAEYGGNGADKQWVYPLIDYTGDPKWLPSDSINGGVFADRLFPASFTRYVLGIIEQQTGYTITGDVLDPNYLLNGQPVDLVSTLIWPWAEGKFTRDTNYKARSTYQLYATAAKVTVNNANLALTEGLPSGLPNGYRAGGGILPVAPSTLPTEYFVYQQPTSADRADIRVTITGRASFTVPPACAFTPSASGLTANATNLTGTMTSVATLAVYTPAPGTLNFSGSGMPAGQYDINLTFDLRTDAHRTWLVKYNGAGAITCTNLVTDVVWLRDRGTTEEERLIRFSYPDNALPWSATVEYDTGELVTYLGNVYQSVSDNNLNKPPNTNPADWFLWSPPNYPPRRGSWAWVSGSSGLPNVTVAAWLKMLAQLWGCLVLVDETRREVELFQMKKLSSNRGLAVDWSSKLVNLASSKWNTRGNYGQLSTLRFVNEPLDDVSLGAYTFPVDDTTLPATKNVVELQVAASEDAERWGNISADLWAPVIRRLNEAGEFASNSPKTRVLYLNRVDDVLGDLAYFKKRGTTPYASRTSKQPMAYFAPNSITPYGLGLGYDYLWPLHWVWLGFMTDQYKELQATFNLDASDVYKLDWRVPVYIAQLGAFFFVQQVKDWVPGRPVTVELVKL